ncbi:MAG: hypothetical protein ABSA75_15710 [Candidatus Bathyarchaeia archaeon]|jgi:hypothetical protein
MEEKTIIENRSSGSAREKELREETGAKYPDKTVVHVSLEGFESDYEAARLSLKKAKLQLEKVVDERKEPKES